MLEIEVKILEIDVKAVKRKLANLGAKQVFSGVVESIFFDTRDCSLAKKGKLLRLRKLGRKVVLTFKEKIKGSRDYKVRKEEEILVVDFKSTRHFLKAVGFKEMKSCKKRRESFSWGKLHCEIDEYLGIPPFLEIEGTNEKDVLEGLEKLGFNKKQAKPWTTDRVLKYYKR